MRCLLISAVMACLSLAAGAQTRMERVWVSMPDSLFPYLSVDKRTDMVNFYKMGVEAEVPSLVGESCVLDTLTDCFATVRMNHSLTLQLALLPRTDADSVLCMVRTYRGEDNARGGEFESVVDFYDMQWRRMPEAYFIDEVPATQLVSKPESMDESEYADLLRLCDMDMRSMQLDPDGTTLTVKMAFPLVSDDDWKRVQEISKLKELKWDGRKFK